MVICTHSDLAGICDKGRNICCRHCEEVEECIKIGKCDALCWHIENLDDLKKECAWENEQ